MSFTPICNGITVSRHKAFCKMVMIQQTVYTVRSISCPWQFPQKLRNNFQKIYSIFLFIGISQVICKGKGNIFLTISVVKYHTSFHLRFVCKNGWDGLSKFISQCLIITFMSHFYKPFYCFFIQYIHISLVVKPWTFRH